MGYNDLISVSPEGKAHQGQQGDLQIYEIYNLLIFAIIAFYLHEIKLR